MFLSLLNAALSSFTIFRIDMNVDKDIDGVSSKFQKSVKLIKDGSKLFRGKLCVSVIDDNSDAQNIHMCAQSHSFQVMCDEDGI